MSDTIKSIIQLNGGKYTNGLKLQSRELFIDNKGYIYYGPMDSNSGNDIGEQAAADIRVKEADTAIALKNNDSSFTGNYITLPGLTYGRKALSMGYGTKIIFDNSCYINAYRVQGLDIHGISGNTLISAGDEVATFKQFTTITLNAANYGSENPSEKVSNPAEGQLYFQILEE